MSPAETLTALDLRVETRTAQPYVAIPRRTTRGLAAAVDGALPRLEAWLTRRRLEAAGPTFVRSRISATGPDATVVEVAVPVATPQLGDRTVMAGTLPAGRYVSLEHVGSYGAPLEQARAALIAFVGDHGWGATSITAHLLVTPHVEPDPAQWWTELACHVATPR